MPGRNPAGGSSRAPAFRHRRNESHHLFYSSCEDVLAACPGCPFPQASGRQRTGQRHRCLRGAATSTHTEAAAAPPNAVPWWNEPSYLGTRGCFCLWLLRELSVPCRCSSGLESSTQHPPRGRSQWGEARESSSSAGTLGRLTCFPKASSNTLPRNRLGGDLIASPRFLAACGVGHATSPPWQSRMQITSPAS